MKTYAKPIVAAAAVLVVAIVGCQSQPGSGALGDQSTNAPSSDSAPLAHGTFTAKGEPVELNATGAGDGVTGTMTVGADASNPLFAVDLTCAVTAEDGRILIAGDTTESTADWATEGAYTAIVLKPGSPGHAVFAFGSDAASAASCMEFLEEIIDQHFTTAIGNGALEPIKGRVELAP